MERRQAQVHPDFLIRLSSGKTLVLEIKGEDSEQSRAKLAAMRAWVDAPPAATPWTTEN